MLGTPTKKPSSSSDEGFSKSTIQVACLASHRFHRGAIRLRDFARSFVPTNSISACWPASPSRTRRQTNDASVTAVAIIEAFRQLIEQDIDSRITQFRERTTTQRQARSVRVDPIPALVRLTPCVPRVRTSLSVGPNCAASSEIFFALRAIVISFSTIGRSSFAFGTVVTMRPATFGCPTTPSSIRTVLIRLVAILRNIAFRCEAFRPSFRPATRCLMSDTYPIITTMTNLVRAASNRQYYTIYFNC